MAEASGRLLTPPSVKEDRTGWVAYQLDAPGNRDTPIKTTLLYVYRLYDRQDTQVIYPQGLTPGTSYLVKREDELESSAMRITAEELISQGLTISLPQQFLAALYSIIANT